ncbi:hypothetical protein [Niallia taxi]|uniref:hypothetical protein n=1 Tax=Niallia taxi TaxID=2499688 RepID=UPI00300AFFFD
MSIPKGILTEEKVKKLMPIIEQILSRKHGKDIKFNNLTVGDITIKSDEERS